MSENITEQSRTIDPLAVIVCDDIRQEINGKHILIGVYGEDIIVPSIPTIMSLCFWIQIRMNRVQVAKARIRITDPSGSTAGESDISFTITNIDDESGESVGSISMPKLHISIMQTGTINIYWSSDGAEFFLIGKKIVKTGYIATASAPYS